MNMHAGSNSSDSRSFGFHGGTFANPSTPSRPPNTNTAIRINISAPNPRVHTRNGSTGSSLLRDVATSKSDLSSTDQIDIGKEFAIKSKEMLSHLDALDLIFPTGNPPLVTNTYETAFVYAVKVLNETFEQTVIPKIMSTQIVRHLLESMKNWIANCSQLMKDIKSLKTNPNDVALSRQVTMSKSLTRSKFFEMVKKIKMVFDKESVTKRQSVRTALKRDTLTDAIQRASGSHTPFPSQSHPDIPLSNKTNYIPNNHKIEDNISNNHDTISNNMPNYDDKISNNIPNTSDSITPTIPAVRKESFSTLTPAPAPVSRLQTSASCGSLLGPAQNRPPRPVGRVGTPRSTHSDHKTLQTEKRREEVDTLLRKSPAAFTKPVSHSNIPNAPASAPAPSSSASTKILRTSTKLPGLDKVMVIGNKFKRSHNSSRTYDTSQSPPFIGSRSFSPREHEDNAEPHIDLDNVKWERKPHKLPVNNSNNDDVYEITYQGLSIKAQGNEKKLAQFFGSSQDVVANQMTKKSVTPANQSKNYMKSVFLDTPPPVVESVYDAMPSDFFSSMGVTMVEGGEDNEEEESWDDIEQMLNGGYDTT